MYPSFRSKFCSGAWFLLPALISASLATEVRADDPAFNWFGLAGSPTGEFGTTDGMGRAARFHTPQGLAADGTAIYVGDLNNHTVRKLSPSGEVTTFAGVPTVRGASDGRGDIALFDSPGLVALGPSGNLYVADWGAHTVRKITPAGQVSTLAGFPYQFGRNDGTGSGARFNYILGIAVDRFENVYVAENVYNTIRQITPAGVVTTLAGSSENPAGATDGLGSEARFNRPQGLAIDDSGNIYVADTGNATVRKITPDGMVTTLAGSAGMTGTTDGIGEEARFTSPAGIAVDLSGTIYISDTVAHTIRKITPSRVVSTIGGVSGNPGQIDGKGNAARFYVPWGLAVDGFGNILVADSANNAIRIGLTSQPRPFISIPPRSLSISAGDTAIFSVLAINATTYQWLKNGTAIEGAISNTLTLSNVQIGNAGEYQVVVSGAGGTVQSSVATLTVVSREASTVKLINLSTRSFAGAGSSVQIAGFIISGSAPRKMLIRAGGPYLSQFGVPDVLPDPILSLNGGPSVVTNDDWSTNATEVSTAIEKAGGVGFSPGSKDAALVATLTPGVPYTALVTGKGTATGNAIVEVYDIDDNAESKLINISTRSYVGTGANIQIGGFILRGVGSRKVLIRVGGPYLAQYGVDNVLADPVLTVFQGPTQIAQNDDWSSNASDVGTATSAANIIPFAAGSKDAGMVLTLSPDTPYTAQVSGKNGSTGNALIEIFEVP